MQIQNAVVTVVTGTVAAVSSFFLPFNPVTLFPSPAPTAIASPWDVPTPPPFPTAPAMPTMPPFPTQPPQPTFTPLPTLTPLPTFTPFPSFTPNPNSSSDFTSCVNDSTTRMNNGEEFSKTCTSTTNGVEQRCDFVSKPGIKNKNCASTSVGGNSSSSVQIHNEVNTNANSQVFSYFNRQ